jgi:hypothetical protein
MDGINYNDLVTISQKGLFCLTLSKYSGRIVIHSRNTGEITEWEVQ